MLELDIYSIDGKKVDSVKIDEAIFGGVVNLPVLREAILMHQANRRSGTSSAKNRVDVAAKKVYLSRILEWYGSDFQGMKGTPELRGVSALGEREAAVIRYLARYSTEAERGMLDEGGFTIVYNEYDWGLNKQ